MGDNHSATEWNMPPRVLWSYAAGAAVLAIGLAAMLRRGDWPNARRLDKLILLGPLFYAAPLAAFGTEHFTVTAAVASIMPPWMPWPRLWVYFVGACFVAAALSLATRIGARVAASLLAMTFLLFVVLMDAPAAARAPRDRFALALALRELSFGAGALALAASLAGERRARLAQIMTTAARLVLAVTALFYGVEQLLHGRDVPAVPLDRATPEWLCGHAIWTFAAGVLYVVCGALLLVGRKSRAAATALGATVLFVELVVYLPIAVVDRASLANGLNYAADTLMFAGAVLLVAGALPRAARFA